MMSDQYQQTFTTTDDHNNVTYIQFIHPSQNVLYCKDEVNEGEEEYYTEETEDPIEETLEDSLIEEDGDPMAGETIEVLEQVFVERKKTHSKSYESHHVSKKLVQVTDNGKPKGRKRIIADQTRAIRKVRANTNKPYVNAKGVEVKPKQFDETFVCSCPKECTNPNKLTLKTRRQIFNMFWNIGSYEGRCAFLNSCVNEAPKKRCYTKNKEESRRKMTRKYFLKGVEVCKTTFTKTLMISNSRIDVSLQKMESESFNDERGKKKAGHGFSDDRKEKVISHIRDNYLPESSLRGLWGSYTADYPFDPVSESYYKRMFYENFNIKVRKLKKEIKTEVKTEIKTEEENPYNDMD